MRELIFLLLFSGQLLSQDTLHIYYQNADSIGHTFLVTKSYNKTTYKKCIDKVYLVSGVKPEMIMIKRRRLDKNQLSVKKRLLKG